MEVLGAVMQDVVVQSRPTHLAAVLPYATIRTVDGCVPEEVVLSLRCGTTSGGGDVSNWPQEIVEGAHDVGGWVGSG